MAMFVVRIEDMSALIASWETLLLEACGGLTRSQPVFDTLDQWPRIKWFYYCDNRNGNTIRLYDTEHMAQVGTSPYDGHHYYLEHDDRGREHFERVIIRGEHMWPGEEANLGNRESLINRFRRNPLWKRWPVDP